MKAVLCTSGGDARRPMSRRRRPVLEQDLDRSRAPAAGATHLGMDRRTESCTRGQIVASKAGGPADGGDALFFSPSGRRTRSIGRTGSSDLVVRSCWCRCQPRRGSTWSHRLRSGCLSHRGRPGRSNPERGGVQEPRPHLAAQLSRRRSLVVPASPIARRPLHQHRSATGASGSELLHEGDEVALLVGRELDADHEVEELDRVLEREQPAVVQVRRRVLDAAQRERLDRPVGARHARR